MVLKWSSVEIVMTRTRILPNNLLTYVNSIFSIDRMKIKFLFLFVLVVSFSEGTFATIPKCPDDLTKLEQDGIYSVGNDEGRFKELQDCHLGSRQEKFNKVNKVELKTKDCKCFTGNWEAYSPLNVDKTYSFKISKTEPIEDCKEGEHFIICKVPGDCYAPDPKFSECSMPKYSSLACPKECLKWQKL